MTSRHETEGVVKFACRHRREGLEERRFGEVVCALAAWREILGRLGVVGRAAGRYEGAGFGNVSARVGAPGAARGRRGFLITGTQTGGRECVTLADFALVESYDIGRNRVESRGLVEPSSESMTHGAVYDLGAHIRVVFHAHSPILWRRARRLRLPITDPAVAYGTPEMAREVARLYRSTNLAEGRILAMGGHEDGLLVFGRDAGEAGGTLLAHLARAYEAQCQEDGVGLCSTV